MEDVRYSFQQPRFPAARLYRMFGGHLDEMPKGIAQSLTLSPNFFTATQKETGSVHFAGVFAAGAFIVQGVHFASVPKLNTPSAGIPQGVNFGGTFKVSGLDLAVGRYRR